MPLFACAAIAFLIFASPARAFDLIRGGKPACTVVVPNPCTPIEKQGAETLANYLRQATGAELPIIPEGQKVDGPILSFGHTRLAQSNGIKEKRLKWDGYRMVVKKGVFYLLGRDEKQLGGTGAQGSRRAALAFLERLGFRWLQPTPMGTYVPKMKDVSVPDDMDVTYTPPFMFMHGTMTNWEDWSLANSFRSAAKIYTAGGHTWVYGVPASLYESHPEYFLMQKGQRIKPTDPNNPQYCPSNPDVIRRVADWTIGKFNEGYEIVALGQSDAFVPCECPRCSKWTAAEQVQNAEREIIELIRKRVPNRKVHLLIYAPSQGPPVDFKRYPSNTMVEVCLTGGLQEQFGTQGQALSYWSGAVKGGMTVYSYYIAPYSTAGFAPLCPPSLAAEKVKDWVGHRVQGVYWCGGGENWGAEGPTYYVIGRLATDPGLDWKKEYSDYIDLTFGKAAPAMKAYYDTLYSRLEAFRWTRCDCVLVGYKNDSDTFTSTFTADLLLRLESYLKQAKKLAVGDPRALGWVRTAEISYEQYALIARAFHFYQAYLLNQTPANLEQVQAAVTTYRGWAEETVKMLHEERTFTQDFFPSVYRWTSANLESNYGHLNCPPFNWDVGEAKPPGGPR